MRSPARPYVELTPFEKSAFLWLTPHQEKLAGLINQRPGTQKKETSSSLLSKLVMSSFFVLS
ncbi:MAG: hypothetical protein DI617_05810 [Streptococcus pyogenes]|nr:MAG: hypothetical protein DI617_05810 [Streptococcus pyogenes]